MKVLLSAEDFKVTEKAELIEVYKELYNRYFCMQTELHEVKYELRTLRQEQAAAADKKTAPKQYAHDASKAFKSINDNCRVVGKPMTATQLKTILSFMAERDYGFSTSELIGKSVLWANALINKMIKEKAKYPKRLQRYNPEELYTRFIQKYPEWYKEVSAK